MIPKIIKKIGAATVLVIMVAGLIMLVGALAHSGDMRINGIQVANKGIDWLLTGAVLLGVGSVLTGIILAAVRLIGICIEILEG